MPDAGKKPEPAPAPPVPPAAHRRKPDKPLANTLLDDVTDVRAAVGRTTPLGTDPEPAPAPSSPAVPIEHGPEAQRERDRREKHDSK
jgi:hypothetical protein